MPSQHDLFQEEFFNQTINQFPKEKIIKPLLQHQLEVLHIKRLLDLAPPKNILDFGSGSGRITIPLLKDGFNVWAVDLSRQSSNILTEIYNKYKTKSWGTIHTASRIPNNIQFDAVIGADILHHISIQQYLPKFYKALKSGGKIVFSEPNAWHLPWYVFFLLFYSWNIEKGILQCSLSNLKKNWVNAGFWNINIEGHGLLPTPVFNHLPALATFNALTLGNIPIINIFAFRLIISARK